MANRGPLILAVIALLFALVALILCIIAYVDFDTVIESAAEYHEDQIPEPTPVPNPDPSWQYAGNRPQYAEQQGDTTYRLGVYASSLPSLVVRNGRYEGLRVTLSSEVCRIAGKKCTFVLINSNQCWNEQKTGPGLLSRYVDICVGWFPLLERKLIFDATDPITSGDSYASALLYVPGRFPPSVDQGRIGFITGFFNSPTCLRRTGVTIDATRIVYGADNNDLVARLWRNELDYVFTQQSLPSVQNLTAVVRNVDCGEGGIANLYRKGEDIASWWNPAFKQMQDTGRYQQLCAQAQSKYGVDAGCL